VDAVSSLGVEDFSIDDFPGVAGWASCPQKGICCLPLTYAPVSFTDRYIETLRENGAYTYANHPIFEARHWGIVDGKDVEKGVYHRTHSAYAVSAMHEALRIALQQTIPFRAKEYAFHENALRTALTEMGCEITSNMTSLIVLNLPGKLAGREMELVQNCRAQGFGIWPTLSEPVQVRIGILNLLNQSTITDIAARFAEAMNELGANIDVASVVQSLDVHYGTAIAAE
jgi:aspartate aminotransferase-like enzyme